MAEHVGESLPSNKVQISVDQTFDHSVDQIFERNSLNILSEENDESDSRYFLSDDYVSVCRWKRFLSIKALKSFCQKGKKKWIDEKVGYFWNGVKAD